MSHEMSGPVDGEAPGGARVLIVDDEEDFADTLAQRLEARGLQVVTVASGEAAIEAAERGSFEAILLDMAMPGMNGIETLKRLRELSADLQIILVTGRATMAQAVEAMKLGALDLLEKPVDIATIVAKVTEAATKKSRLAEQRMKQQMTDILRKKGW